MPTPAGLAGLRAAVRGLRDELDGMRGSSAFAAAAPWAGELLEERMLIEQQLGELEEQAGDVEYVEQPAAGSHRSLAAFRASTDRGRTSRGLRPRLGYTEIRHTVAGEAVERRLAGLLTVVRDHLDVLGHRVQAAEAGAVDRCTLVWECAGLWNREALSVVSQAALNHVLNPSLLFQVEEQGRWSWHADLPSAAVDRGMPVVRRIAACVEGPGARELLAPLAGWAVIHVAQGGVSSPILVRCQLVEGVGADAIAIHDVNVALARTVRRRQRSATTLTETGAVVLRRDMPNGPVLAVATGRSAFEAWPLAAAFARHARRGRG